MRGEITLIVDGFHATPSDRLGLTFSLPEGYTAGVVTLTWAPTLPANDRLGIRLHEAGVLDAEGRIAGSSPLVLAEGGTSPLVVPFGPGTLGPAAYDVHAYTHEGDAAPVAVDQPFDLAVSWS